MDFEFMQQPDVGEFMHKRATFARLQEMAVQMQHVRRSLGYLWLEGAVGGISDLAGTGGVRIHARQSGLILVNAYEPGDRLRLELATPTRLQEFHQEDDTVAVAEYVWDEAMFVKQQA
jgi:hypothetical protein